MSINVRQSHSGSTLGDAGGLSHAAAATAWRPVLKVLARLHYCWTSKGNDYAPSHGKVWVVLRVKRSHSRLACSFSNKASCRRRSGSVCSLASLPPCLGNVSAEDGRESWSMRRALISDEVDSEPQAQQLLSLKEAFWRTEEATQSAAWVKESLPECAIGWSTNLGDGRVAQEPKTRSRAREQGATQRLPRQAILVVLYFLFLRHMNTTHVERWLMG